MPWREKVGFIPTFIVCFVQKYGNPQTYMTSTDIFLPFHLFYSVFYSFSRKSIHYSRHVHCHVIWFAVGNAYTYFNILYDGMTFSNESYLRLSILLPFLLRYHYLLVILPNKGGMRVNAKHYVSRLQVSSFI